MRDGVGRSDAQTETPNTLGTWCEELTLWKRPWCWERFKTGGEKGTTEDEMIGWHHWLDADDGQGSLASTLHGVTKSQTRLSNWTDSVKLTLLNLFWKKCYFVVNLFWLIFVSSTVLFGVQGDEVKWVNLWFWLQWCLLIRC